MMKKKMGFGLGNLRMMPKANEPTLDTEDDWPEGDDDDYDYISHVDTPFICRPPKLDAHTERDLRKACAVILENLKPSGYDIEDTRMKSDILVNNTDLQQKYMSSQPRAHRPQVNAPWNLGGGAVDQSSSFVDSRRIIRDLEKSQRDPRDGHTSDRKAVHSSSHSTKTLSTHPHPLQSQPTHGLVAAAAGEAPLAPVPTITQPTPHRAPGPNNHSIVSSPSHSQHQTHHYNTRPVTGKRADSSSTVSSVTPTSNYDARSESTDVTSAAFTPISSSKRVSDNEDAPRKVVTTDSKTSEWMKETVNRRIRAEVGGPESPNESEPPAVPPKAPHHQSKKSWALFSKHDKKPSQNLPKLKDPIIGHATKMSISRPKSSDELRAHLVDSPKLTLPQVNSVKLAEIKMAVPAEQRPGSSGSIKSQTRSLRAHDLAQDVPLSPRFRKDIIPPVPSISRLKDPITLNGESGQSSPSLLASFTQALPKSDDVFDRATAALAPTSAPSAPVVADGPPVPAKPPGDAALQTVQAPAPALNKPLPERTLANHSAKVVRQEITVPSTMNGDSVLSLPSPFGNTVGVVSPAKKSPLMRAVDPEAADFDFLMGFMQDRPSTEAVQQGHYEAISRAKSFAEYPMQAERRPSTTTKQTASYELVTTEPVRPSAGGIGILSNNSISNRSRSNTSHGLPPTSRLSTDPAAAHYLYGPGGAVVPKSGSNGVKRFFKRLGGGGGGDSYAREYIPQRDPYRKYNDERSDDDGDWDEEACAAPVVGFGRGW